MPLRTNHKDGKAAGAGGERAHAAVGRRRKSSKTAAQTPSKWQGPRRSTPGGAGRGAAGACASGAGRADGTDGGQRATEAGGCGPCHGTHHQRHAWTTAMGGGGAGARAGGGTGWSGVGGPRAPACWRAAGRGGQANVPGGGTSASAPRSGCPLGRGEVPEGFNARDMPARGQADVSRGQRHGNLAGGGQTATHPPPSGNGNVGEEHREASLAARVRGDPAVTSAQGIASAREHRAVGTQEWSVKRELAVAGRSAGLTAGRSQGSKQQQATAWRGQLAVSGGESLGGGVAGGAHAENPGTTVCGPQTARGNAGRGRAGPAQQGGGRTGGSTWGQESLPTGRPNKPGTIVGQARTDGRTVWNVAD